MSGNVLIGRGVKRGWNDYTVSGIALPTTGPNPPAISEIRPGVMGMGFVDGAIRKESYFTIHILHDYQAGTLVYPHVHWTHNAAIPAGNVVWGFDISTARGHNVMAYPAPTTIKLQQAALAQYFHHIIEATDVQAIPATYLEPDTLIKMTVFRDPTDVNDTFADTAFLDCVDFHVLSDGYLTHEKARPFTKIIEF